MQRLSLLLPGETPVHTCARVSVGGGRIGHGVPGSLPSLGQKRVPRLLDGLYLYLLIVHSHRGQGAGHFLLGGTGETQHQHHTAAQYVGGGITYLDFLPGVLLLLQHPAGVQRRLRNHHGLLRQEHTVRPTTLPPSDPRTLRPWGRWTCAYVDPGVVHELGDGHPLGGLCLQEGPDQLLGCRQWLTACQSRWDTVVQWVETLVRPPLWGSV